MSLLHNSKAYWHITDPKILDTILKEGLKANNNKEIFLFERGTYTFNGVTNKVADHIAKNQVLLDSYALIKVSSAGFNTEPIQDNVGELTTKLQWILRQDIIEPQWLFDYGQHEVNLKPIYKFN